MKKIFFLLFLFLSITIISCKTVSSYSKSKAKQEKVQKLKKKKAEKDYKIKAKKHLKIQSKETKKRMINNRKKMMEQTPVKKRSFWNRIFGT